MNNPYVLTRSSLLLDIANESPRAAQLLAEYGLHCLTCFFKEYETLEIGAKSHAMSDEEIDNMIKEINAQLKKEWDEDQKSKCKNQKLTKSLKL